MDLIFRLYYFIEDASKLYSDNSSWFNLDFYFSIVTSQMIEYEEIVTLVYVFDNSAFGKASQIFRDLIRNNHFKIDDYPDYIRDFLLSK